jgi:hypothetical protein
MASIFFMSGLLSVRAGARGVIPAATLASTVPSPGGGGSGASARFVGSFGSARLTRMRASCRETDQPTIGPPA